MALWPLWSGSPTKSGVGPGRAFDVVNQRESVDGAGGLGSEYDFGHLGWGVKFNNSTSQGIKVFQIEDLRELLDGETNATFWVLGDYTSDQNGIRMFASGTSLLSTTNFMLGTSNSDNARFQLRLDGTTYEINGAAGSLNNTSSDNDHQYFHWFGRLVDGEIMYLNRISAIGDEGKDWAQWNNSSMSAAFIDFDQNQDVAVGGLNGDTVDGTRNCNGRVLIAGIWKRALSKSEMMELVRDPFGLIRPDLPTSVLQTIGGFWFPRVGYPTKPGKW